MSDEQMNEQNNFKNALNAAGIFLLELIKIAVFAGVTIFLVRYFLFKPFYVKGASMEPSFYEKEYLIIDEITYRLHSPQRGDVIVFVPPTDAKEHYLKRIIGLPGERVKVSEGKVILYNADHPEGTTIDEAYLPNDLATSGEKNVVLGDDEYFVLGDNRNNSFDSRRFGPITRANITGRAWLRGWPPNRAQIFKSPNFNL